MANSAQFEIALKDGVSPAAGTADEALGNLKAQIDRTRKELAQANRAMRDLKKGGAEGSQAFADLKAKAEAQQATIAKATARYVDLGGTFRATKKSSKGVSDAMGTQKAAMADATAASTRFGSALSVVKTGALGFASAAGAVVVALAAIAAATAAAGAALVAYGIKQADARREESLRLEGLTRLRTVYGTVGGSADELQSSIDRVADSTGASRSTLEQYATRLHRMGIRGGAATAALEGAAIRGAALGDRYGAQFIGMAASAAHAGTSVRELADDVKARLGDLAERRMLSLDNITRRWRENMAGLFRNVDVEGFLYLMNEVVKVFSQSRVTGRALAGVLSRLFSPLNAGAEEAADGVRSFAERVVLQILRAEGAFLQFQIKALEAYNGIKGPLEKLREGFRETFGDVDWSSQIMPVLAGIAGFIGTIAVVALALGAVLAAPFVAAAAAGAGVAAVFDWIGEKIDKMATRLSDAWDSIDLAGTASSMIDGIVVAVMQGIPRVISAMTQLGQGAINTLRTLLQIRSPSRVFAGLGKEIPRGLAVGVDDEAPAANRAVSDILDIPTTGAATAGAGASSSPAARAPGGANTAITIDRIEVNAPQATDAAGIAAGIKTALADALEGLLVTSGEAAA